MKSPSFINPAPYGQVKYESEKNIYFLSVPGSKLVSPYDGKVVYDMTPPCENSIKIKHDFNGEEVYSIFCHVTKRKVLDNEKVKQGDLLGLFEDDKIYYFLVDDNGKKQNLKKFFYYKVDDDSKKDERESVKKGKEEKKKDNDDDKKSEKKEPVKKEKEKKLKPEGEFEDIFLNLLLAPVGVLGSSNKKSKEDDKKLKEDITRIKKLIK